MPRELLMILDSSYLGYRDVQKPYKIKIDPKIIKVIKTSVKLS